MPRPRSARPCACLALVAVACSKDVTTVPNGNGPGGGNGAGADAGTAPVDPCEGPQDPGRVTLHRLNRAEYNNTVRDLLGDRTRPADDFPADDHGYGFDNNADVLATSPVLFEKYEIAAANLIETSLKPAISETTQRYEAETSTHDGCGIHGDFGPNLCRNGDVSTTIMAAFAGEYELSVRAFGQQAGPDPARMQVTIDGRPLIVFDVTATEDNPFVYRTRSRLTAGTHAFVASFINDYYDQSVMPADDRNLVIDYLEVRGPLDRPPDVPPDRRSMIITCDPAATSFEACAREVLTKFGRRAWRRPLAAAELDRLVALAVVGRDQGDTFDAAIALPLQALLLSPHFIFRVEIDPDPTSKTPHPLSEDELASRLSYFLWSSMPDDELFAAAGAQALSDRTALSAQVDRMLRDEKSAALTDNFAGQWLLHRAVDDANPDYALYPDWDDALRISMREESRLFFSTFMLQDLSALDMLDAPFTFLNDRLARHYGLPLPGSDLLQRVDLPADGPRAGLLTQASLLTVTSYPKRTSPVKRGKWVMESLLCDAPPPPPPGVENLPEPEMPMGSLRKRMEQHRADPFCAQCHEAMDPIGFGLEEFDAIGKFRTEDEAGFSIDSSGELPDKRSFAGARSLAAILEQDPRTPRCMSEKLFTYALGRGPEWVDRCDLKRIGDAFGAGGYRLGNLAQAIVHSDAFTMRRGEGEDE